jgi:hypothetical protein
MDFTVSEKGRLGFRGAELPALCKVRERFKIYGVKR